MSTDEFIQAQAALFAWRETHRYGGVNEMLAILHVIRNRARAGWEDGDWLKIIQNADRAAAHPVLPDGYPDINDEDFCALLVAVTEIYAGSDDDITGGALYYADLSRARLEFRARIASSPEQHPKTAQVGTALQFWK